MSKTPNAEKDVVQQLREIMQRLRDPETGCAWDVQQTFTSIAPFTVEEAYEVADAIERNDLDDLKDELGDLLFQVVFHSQMASEMGAFNFDDVAQSIVDKMIRRHPHVFGDTKYETEAELKSAWEAIKAEERRIKDKRLGVTAAVDQALSALDGVAINLPALKKADKVQKRAARVGFDWPDVDPVWGKINEEVVELKQALESGDAADVEDELGDLLFTVVNLARHLKVDSETALNRSTAKFDQRFRAVEKLAMQGDKSLPELSLMELDALWEKAKGKST